MAYPTNSFTRLNAAPMNCYKNINTSLKFAVNSLAHRVKVFGRGFPRWEKRGFLRVWALW